MTPNDVKKHYRSGYEFRKITGISASSLYNWLKSGYVPETMQYRLEKLTDGALKHSPVTKPKKEIDYNKKATSELKGRVKRVLKNFMERHLAQDNLSAEDIHLIIIKALDSCLVILQNNKGKNE